MTTIGGSIKAAGNCAAQFPNSVRRPLLKARCPDDLHRKACRRCKFVIMVKTSIDDQKRSFCDNHGLNRNVANNVKVTAERAAVSDRMKQEATSGVEKNSTSSFVMPRRFMLSFPYNCYLCRLMARSPFLRFTGAIDLEARSRYAGSLGC